MKSILVVLSFAMSATCMAGPGPQCKQKATEKGLTGQAHRDDAVKCDRGVQARCKREAKEKGLKGGSEYQDARKCMAANG